MMSEVARVLDVNGRFIAQTEPNKMYRWVSSIWSYRQRALQAKQEGSKVRFMIEPPPSHVLLHVNEQTYWSLKRLVRKYFQEYKVATYELALGMDDSLRRTYNAYPYNNLPLLRLFFNRELIAYSKRPRPKRPNYK
ncbi:MAG: hypothetical protein M1548_05695 [Actinobacteria bacterium]|nr:hypothetical protein [Actinomycetota bacterium]